MSDKQSLDTSRRVVVKIGSALLVDQDQGAVYHAWLEALAEDIAATPSRAGKSSSSRRVPSPSGAATWTFLLAP